MMLRTVLIGVVVSLAVVVSGSPLRLGAWNIENFGTNKMSRSDVSDVIKAVIEKYDLMAIQEVVEKKNGTITQLLNSLNEGRQSEFKVKMTPYKQGRDRYAVFYRPSRINIVEEISDQSRMFQFKHPLYKMVLQDVRKKQAQPYQFGMIVLHVTPQNIATELNHLANEAESFMYKMKLPGVLIAGDLNAGPGFNGNFLYRNLPKTSNLKKTDFIWLIDDKRNTHTNSRSKPYDRLIVLKDGGEEFQGRLYDAKPYCYDRDGNIPWMTQQPLPRNSFPCVPRYDNNNIKQLVRKVSDHYPVEVYMY